MFQYVWKNYCVCVGGGASCQGERVARETSAKTYGSCGQLREKARGERNWEPDCFTAAENCSFKTGSWGSSWLHWRDIA